MSLEEIIIEGIGKLIDLKLQGLTNTENIEIVKKEIEMVKKELVEAIKQLIR